jgi:hypothetical protein
MYAWIRRVTPDLFLAALVALLITLVLNKLDARESERIEEETWVTSENGLTADEGIGVLARSIRRSTRVHIPWLVTFGGIAVGLACRNRGWAWLTASIAIIPALLTGASFYIDTPLPGAILTAAYLVLAFIVATATAAIRSHFLPTTVPRSD